MKKKVIAIVMGAGIILSALFACFGIWFIPVEGRDNILTASAAEAQAEEIIEATLMPSTTNPRKNGFKSSNQYFGFDVETTGNAVYLMTGSTSLKNLIPDDTIISKITYSVKYILDEAFTESKLINASLYILSDKMNGTYWIHPGDTFIEYSNSWECSVDKNAISSSLMFYLCVNPTSPQSSGLCLPVGTKLSIYEASITLNDKYRYYISNQRELYNQIKECSTKYGEGYNEGYNTGLDMAKFGVFQSATVDADFTYYNNNTGKEITPATLKELVPNYSYNGVSFQNILEKYRYYNNDTDIELERATLTIQLAQPFVYSSARAQFGASGYGDTYDITIINTNNTRFAGQLNHDSGLYEFELVAEGQIINQIKLYFGRAGDILETYALFLRDGNYFAGYDVGYNKGHSEGTSSGFELGKEQGIEIGKEFGYSEGYNAAVSEGTNASSIFAAAISFVKLFFSLFSDLLKTPIAGDITLGLITIGIPAVFMIIKLVISAVTFLLNRKGNSDE